MFYDNISPVLLKVGPIEIRYYGIIYALGFIIGYLFLKYQGKIRKINLNEQQLDTFLLHIIIGVLLGARIFYIIFYNLQYYFHHLLEIFFLWNGGLSFHGGLLGGTFALYIFCKKNNIKFLDMADILSMPLAIALALGRIGNFINGELYGRITTLPWGVKFKGVEGFRHPSQLYESMKNLVIFSALWSLRKKNLKRGTLFALFLMMYAVFRFLIEFVREPEVYVGSFTMGQVLSIPLFIIGAYILLKQ